MKTAKEQSLEISRFLKEELEAVEQDVSHAYMVWWCYTKRVWEANGSIGSFLDFLSSEGKTRPCFQSALSSIARKEKQADEILKIWQEHEKKTGFFLTTAEGRAVI
jgi:hypothetical protein